MTSHVRWGDKVCSPLIGRGEADFFLAFEKLEAVRHIEMLRPGGVMLVNDYAISPLSVSSGDDEYPDDERIKVVLAAATPNYYWVPGMRLAEELGNARVNNVVMLGVFSHHISVKEEVWRSVIEDSVPTRFMDLNLEAFSKGRGWAEGRRGA